MKAILTWVGPGSAIKWRVWSCWKGTIRASQARGDYGTLVNFEFIAEEIVRTLVGSLGLIAAVLLTTAIAILFALKADSLGKWRQVFGPEGSGESHSHAHELQLFPLPSV